MLVRLTRVVFAVIGVGLSLTGQLRAEAPSWAEMQIAPIVMRMHLLYGYPLGPIITYEPSDGFWRLGPSQNEVRLLRPFFASERFPGDTGSHFWGDQGFLTIRDDRVMFQAYPYEIHFDALSWKMVNRLPVSDGEISGWALQGPFLGARAVGDTGLAAGVFGIGRCVMDIITNSHWSTETCLPLVVPGSSSPRTTTDEQTLLHAPMSPGVIEASEALFSFTDTSWDGNRVLLSFDPDGKGFWRGTELNAHFYPVESGEIQPRSLDLDLDALPFRLAEENGFLSALHYHPPAGRLFGVLFRKPYSPTNRVSLLFSLDPSSGEAEELVGLFDENSPPFAFASFGQEPLVFDQIVPIVADTHGVHGERWRTDLWLYNPSDEPTIVEVRRQSRPESPLEYPLQAHGSLRIQDVLVALGGGEPGDGVRHDALFVEADYRWAEQVVAVARVWTRDPTTGGTYGHAVPSVPSPFGYSNHSVSDPRDDYSAPRFNIGANSFAAHIDLDMREPGKYRHNLGIVNNSEEALQIELAWTFQDNMRSLGRFGPDEEGFRRTTIEVPPNGLRIVNLESVFPGEVIDGWVPRIGVFGSQPAIVWLSMVDNLTGDATFVPYTSFSATSAIQMSYDGTHLVGYRMAIPVVAVGPGVAGSQWQTDLYGYSDGHYAPPLRPVAVFHPSKNDECSPEPGSQEILTRLNGVLPMPLERWVETLGFTPDLYPPEYVEPLETVFPDVVRLFPECSGASSVRGGLEVLTGSWFSGFSRTYSTRSDGGTYGGVLPLYPPGGYPVQHFAGLEVGEETRINIGLFNGSHDQTMVHILTLYDAEGSRAAQRRVVLGPLESLQKKLETLFRADELPPGSYGLTVDSPDIPADGVQGRSWAYVSVIDNRTNDPANMW